jgi:signal transduction histidine kinase
MHSAQTLGASRRRLADYAPAAADNGDSVLVTVEDTGEGLDPGELDQIFERFYRTDTARSRDRGSGIGLTISRALIEAHGGKLWAESDGHGQGAASPSGCLGLSSRRGSYVHAVFAERSDTKNSSSAGERLSI